MDSIQSPKQYYAPAASGLGKQAVIPCSEPGIQGHGPAKERAECWTDLAGTAKKAFSSMWKLEADKTAVDFLRQKLPPAAAPTSQKEIQKLVAGLASDQVAARAQAAKELSALGPPAAESGR